MDKNLPRWLKTSLVISFSDDLEDYTVFVEGMHKRHYTAKTYVELRVSGPSRQVLHGTVKYLIDVNVLVYHTGTENIYKMSDLVGAVVTSCRPSITAYKYGDGIDDTGDVIDCLNLVEAVRGDGGIRVTDYGIVDRDLNVLQSTVECQYELTLDQ